MYSTLKPTVCNPMTFLIIMLSGIAAVVLQPNTDCPMGYTPENGTCSKCPIGSFKNHSGNSLCSECLPGTYMNATGAFACIQCSPNSSATHGHSRCLCNAGYTGFEGSNTSIYYIESDQPLCGECEHNTWKALPGQHRCESCPVNSKSAPGATDITNCSCNTGYSAIHQNGQLLCKNGVEYTLQWTMSFFNIP